MPRKKKVTTVTEEIPDELIPSGTGLPADELPDEYEAVQNVLSQFGETGVKIKVSKQGPKGPEYCFSTEELDEDYIQQYFGGGRYVLRIYVNDQFQRSVPLNIADRKAIPNGPAQHTQNDSVLEMMREHNKTLLTILQSALNGGGARSSVSELSAAIKDLGFHNNGNGGGMEKMIDVFMKGMELSDRAGGKGDWKTELFQVIRDVAPGAMEMMKNNNNQPRPSTALPPVTPAPAQVTDEHAQIRQLFTYLKTRCMGGVHADLIVEWTVSHSQDPQYQYFIGFALNTPFEEIVKIDPEVGREPYKPWFESIINGLRLSFTDEDTVESTVTAFPGGDKANAPVNGGVGATTRKAN